MGLPDFGSRTLDTSIGRWIQPDSVVPLDGQGTQALDRYAYVNNNPVRFIDPSGHKVVGCGTEEVCTSSGREVITDPPPLKDTEQCDYPGWYRNLNAKGRVIYELYRQLKNEDGWWNADGDFTPEEFFDLMLYWETNGNADFGAAIYDAVMYGLWMNMTEGIDGAGMPAGQGHSAWCSGDICSPDGMFNYLGQEAFQAGTSEGAILNRVIDMFRTYAVGLPSE